VVEHGTGDDGAGGRVNVVVDEVELALVREPFLAGQADQHRAALAAFGTGIAGEAQVGQLVTFEHHVHRIHRDDAGQHAGLGADQVARRHQGTAGAAGDRRLHLGELQFQRGHVAGGGGGAYGGLGGVGGGAALV